MQAPITKVAMAYQLQRRAGRWVVVMVVNSQPRPPLYDPPKKGFTAKGALRLY
jgi:hypothetical protein